MENSYRTIGKPAEAEFKDRGSRFLAYAFPVREEEEVREHLQRIRKAHPGARHRCYAYRLASGLVCRASDAGEPAGSAGKPILGQLERLGLTGVLVVVVRYFGGTLLGIPGLINAYRTATALALQMTPVVTRPVERHFLLEYDYTLSDPVMRILKTHQCRVCRLEQQLFCRLEMAVPLSKAEACLEALGRLPGLMLTAT